MSGVFTPVGRASWPRGQIFWYYTEAAPTAYSMTVSLDVTKTRLALRAAGRKFFPAYLWLVTRAIREVPELRLAVVEIEFPPACARREPVRIRETYYMEMIRKVRGKKCE